MPVTKCICILIITDWWISVDFYTLLDGLMFISRACCFNQDNPEKYLLYRHLANGHTSYGKAATYFDVSK